MIPAREVGGDFYDFFLIDEHRLGVVIGDVSGKGMPAALFMAVSRTVLKSTALRGLAPAACLEQVNALLCLDNASAMFVTLFYAILDTRSGELAYCNAGHNPPLARRHDGRVERLAPTGDTVLGVLETARYHDAATTLRAGETLLLYTDGVTEAVNPAEQPFSDERLVAHLAAHGHQELGPLVDGVVDAVRRHAGTAPQFDDITVLALRFAW